MSHLGVSVSAFLLENKPLRKMEKIMDYEAELGSDFDAAGDLDTGIVGEAHDNVAEGVEGQVLAESQTDDQVGDELDMESPQFAYTDEEGNEVQLTGQQIVDLMKSQAKPVEEPAKAEEKPAEEAKQEDGQEDDLGFTVTPIDFKKVGPDLVAMLAGEEGGEEALGPAIAEFQFQTFLQDPRYMRAIDRVIETVLHRRESARQETDSFQSFVGAKAQDAEIREFQKSNPWAKTKEMAVLGMQLAATKGEIEKLKAGNTEAVKKAQQEGEKAAIRNLKAKGTLRAIGSKGLQTPKTGDDLTKKYDITDTDQRSRAMAEAILRMRGQG